MVEEMLAARGIVLTYETVGKWSMHFGLAIARRIRRTAIGYGDQSHLDEMVISINGKNTGYGVLWTSTENCSAYWCRVSMTRWQPND